ncbi:hypothetical protein [Flavivirga eckloniae]|uniref:Peptidase G2 IMC autoproteolytic cleavage domain-containing protein n=1 Tax=Flavivirga eckloniae TaxID=1803846 RepID=A0A2K9PL29_9FLAO|nr:hypothetical protein [Flavivirga eckloniae]AUP77773.1 hypothetical protein C1H87_03195 [Flavivirga eckloniae]
MKKPFLTLILTFFYFLSFSQTDGITYQAVIIDNNPQEIPGVDIPSNNLPNTDLQVRFTIIDDGGNAEYQETQSTTTDPYGMINLVMGKGTPNIGAFNQVYWNNSKFLRVEIDLNNGDGMVEFSYQELTYIPYVRHREIVATSTLDVDGATNLNNNLTVNNQSPTYLTGDLTVDGLVAFDGPLEVGGDTQLYADLTVEGITNLNNSLNVNNGATTNLSGDLSVDGTSTFQDGVFRNITVNQSSNLNGQVTIDASLTGGQTSTAAYPLVVRGSDQGVIIQVNAGRNTGKNFVTFRDDFGIHGAIEGQTLSELHSSFRFIWDEAMAGLEQAFTLAEQIACGTQLDVAEAGVMLVNNFVLGAKWIELTVAAENNVGVSYESGGADYAEWLEKENHAETFAKGDIVGVKGGKISKTINDAHHIMVISTNPIVLGNMVKGNENHFEKVAFLGQVPVRVVGKVNVGDYILPSGNNDGTGIAVSPGNMKITDYQSILGVAWEASRNETFGYINVAIGINTNDIALKVLQQDKEIKDIKNKLDLILKKLNGETVEEDLNTDKTLITTKDKLSDKSMSSIKLTDAELEKWLTKYGYIFELSMNQLKENFKNRNVDLKQFPEVEAIVNNPIGTIRKMNSGEYLPTLWKSFGKRYPNTFKKE